MFPLPWGGNLIFCNKEEVTKLVDIKLNSNGDLDISEFGDISLTDSTCQAVKIRLLWIQGEWKLGPELGFPYFEELFIKNPNIDNLRQLIRLEIVSVEGVEDAEVTDIEYSSSKRTAKIFFTFTVAEEKYREEIVLYG